MKLELRSDMKALEKRMDDFFREAWVGTLPALWHASLGRLGQTFAPSSDIFRRGDDLVVRVELPGIDPERDLKVMISDGDLVIKGSRHESEEVKEDDYYRREVWQGSYERHLPLPEGISEEAVSAEYDKGILEVTIHGATKAIEKEPKTEPKAIPVTFHSEK